MSEILLPFYDWLRALHIIAIISWMAAMLYLPRLFVYHADSKVDGEISQQFKIMERKLLKIIMNPAMIAAWVFGLLMLLAVPSLLEEGWMHAKLTLVFLLIGYHHVCLAYLKKFAADANTKSDKFYRIFNEIPVFLLVAIVILAVVRPF